tara:strand:- start:95 stop:496 length:402 start_codon:yes stop_codon:yes gene_type:complete
MKHLSVLLLFFFLLSGCYQTSLAPMLGPAAGASQGRIAHSAISSGINYGVKNQTGKYPIEHILKREKNKIVKKIDLIEKEVVEKSINAKNTLIDKKEATKKKWVLHLKEIKNVKNEDAFPANKPRYSYWSKAK